jgi:hypothetical protein
MVALGLISKTNYRPTVNGEFNMFTNLLKHTVTISRLTAGVGVQKTYTIVASALPAFIQPLNAQQSSLHGHAMGKSYKIFIDPIGVEAGDKIIDIVSNEQYRVQGVEDYDFGSWKHQMAIIVKEES